jgi:hypothetical protein
VASNTREGEVYEACSQRSSMRIVEATGERLSKRFPYALIDEHGQCNRRWPLANTLRSRPPPIPGNGALRI